MENSAQLRRRALIIIVIGILFAGFPIHIFSLLLYNFIIIPLPIAYYGIFIFVVPLLTNTLIVVGLIMLAVALSREKRIEIKEEEIPSTIMIDTSYVKDIAIELASELSYYFYTPVKLKLQTILIDAEPYLHDEVRKMIEKFLKRNRMYKHTVIWDGRQFTILRILNIEWLGLYQCIHCGALFSSPTHENYHRWVHYI